MPGGNGAVMAPEGGESMVLLSRFVRRFAAIVRLTIIGPVAVIALFGAANGHEMATAVVVGGVVAWSAVYVWWLLRGTGVWVTAVDVAVLVLVCLSIFWTDASAHSNVGWIRVLVSFACMAYQWYTPVVYGVVATAVAAGTFLSVALVTGADEAVVNAAVWVLAIATMSRTAWTLVLQGARTADRLILEAKQARMRPQIAAAVSAEDQRLINALHDTAATTLLMVGSGEVQPGDGWLVPRALRDLEMLRAYGRRVPAQADLVQLMRTEIAAVSQLPVRFTAPPQLPVPYQVGRAVADAAREAMNNVVRHAAARQIRIRMSGDPGRLRVDIVDDGRGFALTRVPSTRRGLRECVRGRMAAIQGTAQVDSQIGYGTTVSLEWRGE